MAMKCKGFTLLELMYTVAIIGILAAIALPAYNDYIIRSKVVEGFTVSSEAKSSVNEFYKYTGRMPSNNAEAGLAEPDAYRGNYINAMTIEDGAIHIDYDGLISSEEGLRLTLLPASNPASLVTDLVWVCRDKEFEGLIIHGTLKTTLEPKYLPAQCR
jgi:type IV pilus assembly protein PilA